MTDAAENGPGGGVTVELASGHVVSVAADVICQTPASLLDHHWSSFVRALVGRRRCRGGSAEAHQGVPRG